MGKEEESVAAAAAAAAATRLGNAKLFLREDYEAVDPNLPALLRVLRDRGAGECSHKHGTFYEHLLHVYRMLKLWDAPNPVALCGLFHSAYSNSYVNLAIFEPNVERSKVRDLVGEAAEELIHFFCIVPRQQLIFDNLLLTFSDERLLSTLHEYDQIMGGNETGSAAATPNQYETVGKATHDHVVVSKKMEQLFSTDVNSHSGARRPEPLIPPEGMLVKHIRTGEDVWVPRRVVAIFLLLTMADFADQFFGWQDVLFGNDDGEFRYKGNNFYALWPGDCKPGLWMTVISRMGVLLNVLLKEDEVEDREEHQSAGKREGKKAFSELQIPLPAIFKSCSTIVSPTDQTKARDLYWEAICITGGDEKILDKAQPLLQAACKYNPFVGEPHIVLAQILLSRREFELAEKEATLGLQLLLEWATNWDKRMTWEGWVAWARVLQQNALDKTWAKDVWGIINLGLVK
ncbi:unnamed protein product [Sphagnum balticum]